MNRTTIFPSIISLAFLVAIAPGTSAQGIIRFDEIADDLYYVGNISHNTVFLVTDEGIIMTDPISQDFSTELKAEIEKRFNVPVRYVLYSHHHWDHASGGSVWEDTAQFIGHENMLAHLAPPSNDVALPADAVAYDTNNNGSIESSEAGGAYQTNFDLYDYDGNGALSGGEAVRGPLNDVRIPDITYQDKMTITLGGKAAEMVWTGVHTHTDDMSVIVYPNESVGFMVDFISIVRPPRYIRGAEPIETWIEGIKIVEAQNFNIAAPGHGKVGDRKYVTLFREYLEALRDEVTAGIAAGQSVEQLQKDIYMEEYKDWISYDEFRPSNIEDMYKILTRE
jgi:glyoxylase-like metal-dependent hydrolase (beta-lactamase superfamily II)